MVTRKYLMVDLNSRTDLIDDGHDPRTVFKLHPVLQDRDEITLGGYGRIEHVVTGSWLHSLKGACAPDPRPDPLPERTPNPAVLPPER